MPSPEDFREIIKSKGLKATPQRMAVHEAMLELVHASADMVAERIADKGHTKVTVASVYNILSQLSQMGLYKRRLSANNKMFFDADSSEHVHLYDLQSHSFSNIKDEGLSELVGNYLRKRRFKGYKVDGVDIQILCHPTRKKNPRLLSLFLLICSFLCSCTRDDTILYNYFSCGTADETATIKTDNGMLFKVERQARDFRLDTMSRISFSCDILRRISDDSYTINLKSCSPMLCKNPLLASSLDEEETGHDAVCFEAAWIAGGYLNTELIISLICDSADKHLVNLVYDDIKSNADTLFLELRHNAYGQSADNPAVPHEKIILGRSFACFPISDLLPEGRKKKTVQLSWSWFKSYDFDVIRDVESLSETIEY